MGDTNTFSSNRIIPIPSKLIPLLQQEQGNGNQFVLKGKTHDYIDPRTFQYCFQTYLNESKIRTINYHTLRHTFATRCIETGMDMKSLSELLGHSSVNITLNTYVHSSLEHKRNQLEAMSIYCGQ